MRDTIRLGRIAGIPIGINWSILAVAVYLVISLAFGALPRWWPSADLQARLITSSSITLLFFASILGHELGHAAAARHHGVAVEGITLWVLGGIAKLARQPPTPRAEFAIAAAGPAASLFLAAAFAGTALGLDRWSTWGLAASAASWLAITNAFLGVTNLVPIAPLDGGRVLTALLWRSSNDAEDARLLSARAGLVVGSAVVVSSTLVFFFTDRIGSWIYALTALTGLFIAHAAWREIVGAVIRKRLDRTTLDQVMVSRPPAVNDDLGIETFRQIVGPANVARPVVRWSHDPIGYVSLSATEVVPPAERSWTTVAAVMAPLELVRRAWSTETVSALLERESTNGSVGSIVVVHDPLDGRPTGTLTPAQIEHLFAPPNIWGVAAETPPPPRVPAPL